MKLIIAVIVFHVVGVILRPFYERRFPNVFGLIERVINRFKKS